LRTEFLNLCTAAVPHERCGLQREADRFLGFVPQRPAAAFPQHLPPRRETKTSLEVSWGSRKSPGPAPTQGKQQRRGRRRSVTPGLFGQGSANRTAVFLTPFINKVLAI